MKIKNFVAANMNEAIALVRQELGSEAIILSNQTISGQVHLTAALEDKVDYDFSAENEVETLDVAGHFNDSLLASAISADGQNQPDVLCITAASAAVMTAEF